MNKKNIILDLDNTLVNSLTFKELNVLSKSKEKKFKYVDMDKSYRVFWRPHLQKFLDYLFENFNVSVWSMASLSYVAFIVKNIILIKPERKLDFVFFAYHCSYSKRFLKCAKDVRILWNELKLVGYNTDNVYIIDDLPEIYKTLPKHTIKAEYFDILTPNSENDVFLLDTIKRLEKIRKDTE